MNNKFARRSRGKVLTPNSGIFKIIGMGESRKPGGYSTHKHEIDHPTKCALCDKEVGPKSYILIQGGAEYCCPECATKVGDEIIAEIMIEST